MNNANYDPQHTKTQLDNSTRQSCKTSQPRSIGVTPYLPNYLNNSASQRLFKPLADRQVREDREYYIPDFPSDGGYDSRKHSAAGDHAKHLLKSERLLDEASNLLGLTSAALEDESDSRAMQTKTALEVVEKKLRKAHTQIDRHHSRHTKLCLAYLDLKNETDGTQ